MSTEKRLFLESDLDELNYGDTKLERAEELWRSMYPWIHQQVLERQRLEREYERLPKKISANTTVVPTLRYEPLH